MCDGSDPDKMSGGTIFSGMIVACRAKERDTYRPIIDRLYYFVLLSFIFIPETYV